MIKPLPCVVTCHTHGVQPWHVVCSHLLDAPSQEWLPVEKSKDDEGDRREVEHDYVCQMCADEWIKQNKMPPSHMLRIVCMMHVRDLIKQSQTSLE